MKVLVTGATGFVGRHVVDRLVADGHAVVAVARDNTKARRMGWYGSVEWFSCDLHGEFRSLLEKHSNADALVHLAWPGLPNYGDFFHIDVNLPSDLTFLRAALETGISHVIVAGTCLEYGLKHGPLPEDMETAPTTPYGFAKDVLRKSLQFLQSEYKFTLQWMRLFYMYGKGQNENSLLAQLDRAIDNGDAVFNMSNGDQLRDYLPIEDVAANFSIVLRNPRVDGVINCCSGQPIAVLDLVNQRCMEKGAEIQLNRGFYPYPTYEPLAFWGIPSTLDYLRAK